MKMKRDMSKLSVKEKMAIIEAEAPELLSLLAELKTRLQELKDNVQPMILKSVILLFLLSVGFDDGIDADLAMSTPWWSNHCVVIVW